jgi:hypothetical protein
VLELAREYYRTDVFPVIRVIVLELAQVYYRTDVLPVFWVLVLEFARSRGVGLEVLVGLMSFLVDASAGVSTGVVRDGNSYK